MEIITKIIIKAALLKKQGMTVDELIKDLKEPAESKEYRFKIAAEDFRAYGLSVIDRLEEYAKQKGWDIADDNREGIRISTENGFFLLRLSVHDPVMPMNFESNVKGGIRQDIEGIKEFFKSFDRLDSSALEQ